VPARPLIGPTLSGTWHVTRIIDRRLPPPASESGSVAVVARDRDTDRWLCGRGALLRIHEFCALEKARDEDTGIRSV